MRASFVCCVLCLEYLCYTFARIEERMVADKGGIYFDANWLEVQMKYSYSVVVRGVPVFVSRTSLGNFSCVLKSLLQPPPPIAQGGQK